MNKDQIARLIDQVATAKVDMERHLANREGYDEVGVYQRKLNKATDMIYDEIWQYKQNTPPYNGSYSTLRGNY